MTPMTVNVFITKRRIFIANVKRFCLSVKSNLSSVSFNPTIP